VSAAVSAEDVAERVALIEATYRRPDVAGVCVADGFGVKVTVERGGLVVHDGIGSHRRTRRYDRATHGLRRLVLLQPDGYVTFEALRWCSAISIAVVVLGPDGPVLQSTPRVTDDARLRRAQALAPGQPVGLGIARYLLGAKLGGQVGTLKACFGDLSAAGSIEALAEALHGAGTAEECRQLEASAANLYFGAWAGHPAASPAFAATDRPRVPAHWHLFETRRSVLASANANRKAERPVNALLNYAFALLEAEAVIACQAVGVDPGLGIVHNDAKGRQSMAPRLDGARAPTGGGFRSRHARLPQLPQGRVLRGPRRPRAPPGAAHPRASQDNAQLGQGTRPGR
jgi:CRISPR/Cas system-associated endonuclease Cas1